MQTIVTTLALNAVLAAVYWCKHNGAIPTTAHDLQAVGNVWGLLLIPAAPLLLYLLDKPKPARAKARARK